MTGGLLRSQRQPLPQGPHASRGLTRPRCLGSGSSSRDSHTESRVRTAPSSRPTGHPTGGHGQDTRAVSPLPFLKRAHQEPDCQDSAPRATEKAGLCAAGTCDRGRRACDFLCAGPCAPVPGLRTGPRPRRECPVLSHSLWVALGGHARGPGFAQARHMTDIHTTFCN